MRKNPNERPVAIVKPPFLNRTPSEAPVMMNRILATGRENFLCNSTLYLLLDLL